MTSHTRNPLSGTTLLLVVTGLTLFATVAIWAMLAIGTWAALPFALLSVIVGALIVVSCIGRALGDDDGEAQAVLRTEPAKATVQAPAKPLGVGLG